jgi:hypothetical protein
MDDENTPAESPRAIKLDEIETLRAMVAVNNRDQQEGFRALGLAFGRMGQKVETSVAELTASVAKLNASVLDGRRAAGPPIWYWPLVGCALTLVSGCALLAVFALVRTLRGG